MSSINFEETKYYIVRDICSFYNLNDELQGDSNS